MLRSGLFALFSVVVLTFYGMEVCPFLESLGYGSLAVTLVGAFLIPLLARAALMDRVVHDAPERTRVRNQLVMDLGVFVLSGCLLTIHNSVRFGFPLGSGLKLLVGSVLMGVYASVDLALETDRRLVQAATGRGESLGAHTFRSMARVFAAVALGVLILMGGVIILIIMKDVAWLVTLEPDQLRYGQRAVMAEVVFVVVVLVLLTGNLIFSYSRNLRVHFENQTVILDRVASGMLDRYVPITGSDEFALIASHTNQMIDGLREKATIQEVFGKVVSPEIARRLLANGVGGLKLGGSRRTLVIMFSDIRNFTTFSENHEPEEVVKLLNEYLSRMVKIIREHGGLVDKFIGDGILAVFGLDDAHQASDRAVRAAVQMQRATEALAQEMNAPLAIGIGVHRGDVIAGNVGSVERLEFTFIGDAVNTASRLESMTKTLQSPIIVSNAILADLATEVKTYPWVELGEHELKGKKDKMPLSGLK